MPQEPFMLGGVSGLAVGDWSTPKIAIVLHGREMSSDDLAPFATAMRDTALWLFADAPMVSQPRGRTWWPTDSEARVRALEAGPMDLSAMDPAGRAEARSLIAGLMAALPSDRPIVLAGFSQGGMLAMDYALHAAEAKCRAPSALALLSSTRIALSDWTPRAAALAGQRVLVAHGRGDRELAFSAGEGLRDFALAAGARVTWLPFDGGHELPFVVWRALKKLVREI
jgi:phospholipase/carboxylesterase